MLPNATKVELTEVHGEIEGDVTMEDFDRTGWQEVSREAHEAAGDTPAFSFVSLVRQ
jgi:dihydrofolate reductase